MTTCTCPGCTRRRRKRTVLLSLLVSALAIAAIMLCAPGCMQTVSAETVRATQASFDDAVQNSGIREARPGGFVVTEHFRDRYNALVEDYGNQFAPPLRQDDGLKQLSDSTWFIDAQRMVQFVRMNTWKRSGRIETK